MSEPDPYLVGLARAFMKEKNIGEDDQVLSVGGFMKYGHGTPMWDVVQVLVDFLRWCDDHGMDLNGASVDYKYAETKPS